MRLVKPSAEERATPRGVVGGSEISNATTGATNIFMGRFRVPAGAQSREMLLTLRAFPIRTHRMCPLLPLALEIAMTIGHSVYDCVYLALADEENCRVVTADRRLQDAVAAGPLAESVLDLAELT